MPETPIQEPEKVLVRDFRITIEILEKFGYTQGCAGCEARRLKTEHRNHTAACRDRLEGQMRADANLQETIRRRDMRAKNPKPQVDEGNALLVRSAKVDLAQNAFVPDAQQSGQDVLVPGAD